MADKEIVEPRFVSNKLTADDERPYVVNTDNIEEAKLSCGICQEMACCPEHCCDWDTCECGDCENCSKHKPQAERPSSAVRRKFNLSTWKAEYEPTDEPEVLIMASGEENVEQIKQKKKIAITQREKDALAKEEEEKEFLSSKPQEVVHTNEGVLIYNYEVDFQEEQELMMAGGIKGLRALRMQREQLNTHIESLPSAKEMKAESSNRFEKYVSKKPEQQTADSKSEGQGEEEESKD